MEFNRDAWRGQCKLLAAQLKEANPGMKGSVAEIAESLLNKLEAETAHPMYFGYDMSSPGLFQKDIWCKHAGTRSSVTEWDGPPTTWCDDCGIELVN